MEVMPMAECIFCGVAAGEVSAEKVYEDDAVVAFRDINPGAPTHVLLIPRKHVPSLNKLVAEDDEAVGHLVRVATQIAEQEHIAESGYRLVANCGSHAGQSVDHVHFHLLGGRAMGWPPG
jgi:histidine triad (HIT) family protein